MALVTDSSVDADISFFKYLCGHEGLTVYCHSRGCNVYYFFQCIMGISHSIPANTNHTQTAMRDVRLSGSQSEEFKGFQWDGSFRGFRRF